MPDNKIEPAVNLELRTQSGAEAMVLHCAGQIVSGETSQALRSAVVDLLQRHQKVIVDLGKIDYMDRNGLETLVGLYSSARTAKVNVTFENLTIAVSDSHTRSSHLQQRAG
jgi:anti-anti-sigma factor